MKKVVLITGTSTGLGMSIALKLAEEGHTVYATMRNLEKKSKLESAADKNNIKLEIKQLDVQSQESINTCVSEIISKENNIDVLINNAGAGFIKTTECATEEEIKSVIDVNLLGVIRCTKSVLPHMRKAKSGHIVNISSVGGLVGQPFNELYCAAKFGLEGYTESMATYIQPCFNINFTLVEPGGISSDFANTVFEQFKDSGGMQEPEYLPILDKYITFAESRKESAYQTPDQVAEVVVECIHNPNPPIRVRTSEFSNKFCELKTKADPTGKVLQQLISSSLL